MTAVEFVEEASVLIIPVQISPTDVSVPLYVHGPYDRRQAFYISRVEVFVGMPSLHGAVGVGTPSRLRRVRWPNMLRDGLNSSSLCTGSGLGAESFGNWTRCSCFPVIERLRCLGRRRLRRHLSVRKTLSFQSFLDEMAVV